MSTKKEPVNVAGTSPEESMTLKELAVLLIKHYGYHEGLFDISVQFQLGTGAIGPGEDNLLPGVMIGFSGIGLKKVSKIGSNTLNAAEINPAKELRQPAKPRSKRAVKSKG